MKAVVLFYTDSLQPAREGLLPQLPGSLACRLHRCHQRLGQAMVGERFQAGNCRPTGTRDMIDQHLGRFPRLPDHRSCSQGGLHRQLLRNLAGESLGLTSFAQ